MNTEALEITLREAPGDWETRLGLINKALEGGEPEKAALLADEAPALPEEAEERVTCAAILAWRNPARATTLLEEVIAGNPAHPRANLELAKIHHAHGDGETALRHFATAGAGDPALEALGFERAMAGESSETAATAEPEPVHAPGDVSDDEEDKPVMVAALRPPGEEPGVPVAMVVPHAESRPVHLAEVTSQPVNLPPPEGPTGSIVIPPPPGPMGLTGAVAPVEAMPDGSQPAPSTGFRDPVVAEEALRLQQRKARAASLTIGVLLHGVLLLLFSVLVIWAAQEKPPEIVTYIGDPNAPRTMEKKVVKRNVKMQNTPSAAETRMITSTAPSAVFIPKIEKYVESDAVGLGGIGGGGLGGFGGSGTNFQVPHGMRSRCNKSDRMKRISESGGSVKVERSVVKALDWLAEVQNSDGSWTEAPNTQVGVTGLALLCFLGHCETVNSPKYGAKVGRALDYLLEKMGDADTNSASPLGQFGNSYAFAIGLYALSEAYSMHKSHRGFPSSKLTKLKTVVRKAARRLISGQASDGGWHYSYNGQSEMDTSVVGWQVQALKAAHTTGISIAGLDRCMRNAEDYFKKAQGPNGSFTYRAGNHKASLGGVGTLCMILLGQPDSDVVKKGLEFIATRHPKGSKKSSVGDPYEWYYNMFASIMAGGKVWKQVNNHAMDAYIDSQDQKGFWNTGHTHFPGQGQDAQVYYTTLCTLALEVYYRYLPSAK